MKKRRIVLASILKPVDDTRMFEKMGVSLSRTNEYEIFVIGYPSKHAPESHSNITLFPLKPFGRISAGRLLAPWQVLKIVFKVKPDLLIVNTHELLIVSVANRIFFGGKIVYDIRENYWRNVLHTSAFPSIVKPLIAGWIRLKETLTSPFFHAFFLAEKTYQQELNFITNRYLILENKTLVPRAFKREPNPEKIRLLFSGTLADSTGVFQAIELAKKLHSLNSKIELHIIGFCALASTLSQIKNEIQDHAFITLVGGDQLVPHQQIVDAIAQADFGIIAYPNSHHIENRIPTKLYEYLAFGLPILLQDYTPWVEICQPFTAAIPIDYGNIKPSLLLDRMLTTGFFETTPRHVTWASEESKLIKRISEVLI